MPSSHHSKRLLVSSVHGLAIELVPSGPEEVRAECFDPRRFAELLEAEIPSDWPPHLMTDALPWFCEQICRNPSALGWYHWYALLAGKTGKPVLAGSVGFKGPPNSEGCVEIGYSVLPKWQNRGIARNSVAALVDWAYLTTEVRLVIAETTPDNPASLAVLRQTGFRPAGRGADPGSLRFERLRA